MNHKTFSVLVGLLILVFSLTAHAASQGGIVIGPGKVLKPAASLSLTSPKGGEVWQGGIERTITWSYNPAKFTAQNVQILLLKGDTVVDTIAQSVSVGSNGQGAYKWSTLNVAPGADYRIKIVGITTPVAAPNQLPNAQSGISGYFTITEKAKITITFPQSAGQTLHPGQHVTITWNYTGDIGKTVYLRMIHGSDYPNGGLFSVLVDAQAPAGINGQGSYNWVIPAQTGGAKLPVSATYFFDLGCEYAGVGASGVTFKIDDQPVIKANIQLNAPAVNTLSNPQARVQLDPQPEPPAPK